MSDVIDIEDTLSALSAYEQHRSCCGSDAGIREKQLAVFKQAAEQGQIRAVVAVLRSLKCWDEVTCGDFPFNHSQERWTCHRCKLLIEYQGRLT